MPPLTTGPLTQPSIGFNSIGPTPLGRLVPLWPRHFQRALRALRTHTAEGLAVISEFSGRNKHPIAEWLFRVANWSRDAEKGYTRALRQRSQLATNVAVRS